MASGSAHSTPHAPRSQGTKVGTPEQPFRLEGIQPGGPRRRLGLRPKHTFSSTEKGLLDLLTFLRNQLSFINFLYYSPLFSTDFCYFIISFPLLAFHF